MALTALTRVKPPVADFSDVYSKLAVDSGGNLIGYKYASDGVLSTVQTALKRTVSVKDWGAKCDGVTDDTSAIQKALNYLKNRGGGRAVIEGVGSVISDVITMDGSACALSGENTFGTILRQKTLNIGLLNITGGFCMMDRMSFAYSGTPTTNAIAIVSKGASPVLKDFIVRNSDIAIEVATGTAQFLENFQLYDYNQMGLYAHEMNDIFIVNYIMNAGASSRGTLGGIRMYGRVEAFCSVNGDILGGTYSMTTDSSSNNKDSRPAYNRFTNTFFDGADKGVNLAVLTETSFGQCWFSGGRAGSGTAGCTVGATRNVTFAETSFFNNGAQGALVQNTATGTEFNGCTFDSNSVTAGVGVSHGLHFVDGCKNFKVRGGRSSNGLYDGKQGYGIYVGSSCDQYNIVDADLAGNYTGSLVDNSSTTATQRSVRGNVGARTRNRGTGSLAASATSVTITHGLGYTPAIQNISITPNGATATPLYVASVNGTTFVVQTQTSNTGATPFSWQADVSGD